MNKCDKCGQEVEPSNDSFLLFGSTNSNTADNKGHRHLLPQLTPVPCVGSPSMAQYLEGQPRDERRAFAYNPANENKVREAYKYLQKKYPKT